MKKKDKTKQKTPAASTTLCVNLCFTHTHTPTRAHTHAHFKKGRNSFQFWPGNPCEKRIEVNELLMRLHVSGLNCENKLKWHTCTLSTKCAHTATVHHVRACAFRSQRARKTSDRVTWKKGKQGEKKKGTVSLGQSTWSNDPPVSTTISFNILVRTWHCIR